MEQRPASLRWSRYTPPVLCAATEPRSRLSSDAYKVERHGSSFGDELADLVCGECPRWCCATEGLVSRGTAKEMACGAEPFTCGSRVLHMLRFVAFNIFSVLVIYQWIDGTLAGSKQDTIQLCIRRPWHLPPFDIRILPGSSLHAACNGLHARTQTLRVERALFARWLVHRSGPTAFIPTAVWRLKTDSGTARVWTKSEYA